MNDDDLDLAIRETQHRYADTIRGTEDPVPDVLVRVQRSRRRRRALTTFSAAAASVVVIGGVAIGANLLSSGHSADENAASGSSTPSPSTSSAPSTSTTAPRTLADALRTQLTGNTAVVHRLGQGALPGVVLCTTHVFGGDSSHQHLYVWISCGTYSTGPAAQNLSSGGDPAVLKVKGSGAETEVVAVRFPRLAHYNDDIAAMFPAPTVTEIARREFQTVPTESQMLAEARQLGAQ